LSRRALQPAPAPDLDEPSVNLAALELLRRENARGSLLEFARSIDIPGMPAVTVTEDEEYLEEIAFKPVESAIALHHRVMMQRIQACMERPNGRLMIMAPPGSAKSTYTGVVGIPWAMGRWPGSRYILATYATKLARKQSRKALQIVRSDAYRSIWDERPTVRKDVGAAEEWATSTRSELMAAGILAGITGNRANGVVADDLIAGREEAESIVTREKIMEAYRDDLESRLLKDGWIILINTRWHMDDPCGSILPESYKGESGPIRCQDGLVWDVINLPAKAENADDPLKRKVGEYLWPEWLKPAHWQAFENNPLGRRRWISLYQQRPTGDAGDDFKRADAQPYRAGEQPERLTIYGASDYAVTELDPDNIKRGKIDKTEHGVVGMDDEGDLWFLDWKTDQGGGTGVTIPAFVDLVATWKPIMWWDEGGTIDKAIRPAARREMRERKRFVQLEPIPKIADKRAGCQSFAARYGARTCHFPVDADGNYLPWAEDLIAQLCGYPGFRYDDKYDVAGLIGRGIDKMRDAPKPPDPEPEPVEPYTERWLMTDDTPKPKVRYR
jgi:hypothetical protein